MAADQDFFGSAYIGSNPYPPAVDPSTVNRTQPAGGPIAYSAPTNGGGGSSKDTFGSMPSYVNINDPVQSQVWSAFSNKGITPRDQGDFQYWVDRINQTGGWQGSNAGYWSSRMAQPQGGVGDYNTQPESGGGSFSPVNLASNAQQNNANNLMASLTRMWAGNRPSPGQDPTYTGIDPSTTAGLYSNPSPDNYGNAPNIPPDLYGLRNVLGNIWANNAGQPPAYYDPSNFNLPTPYGIPQASNIAGMMPGVIAGMMGPGMGAMNNILSGGGTDVSSFLPALSFLLSGQASPQINLGGVNNSIGGMYGSANIAGMGLPYAANIAATGGAPMNQLISSLSALQTQGNVQIQNQLAGIRQQYTAQGLGQGSDVNSALASGAAQGVANLNANQSTLLSQVLQNAAQTQLGGINALANIGSTAGNLYGAAGQLGLAGQQLSANTQQMGYQNLISSLMPGLQIMSTPVQQQLAAAGVNVQQAGLMNSSMNDALSAFLNMGQMNQTSNLYSNQAAYNNFVRMNSPSPYLTGASGYATGFPPTMNQIPSAGTQLGSAAIGAGGSVLAALIAAELI